MTTTLQLFAILRKRFVLALLLFVLFAIGGVAAAYVKKPVYEASAKLLLNTESLPLSLSRAELPQIGGGGPTVEAISTLIEIVTAREVIEQLVDDLGEQAFKSPPPSNALLRSVLGWVETVSVGLSNRLARLGLIEQISPRDGLIEALRARLVVYPVRQSQVMEVAISWPTPQVPELATRKLLELFLARIDGLNALASEQNLFSEQADQTAQDLAAAQQDLRALQRDHDVVSPTLEIQRLTERIARNTQALSAPDAGPDGEAGSGAADGSRIDDLLRRISTLEIDLAGAQAIHGPETAAVREVAARLQAAEAALDTETGQIARSLGEDQARLAVLLSIEDRFIAASRTVETTSEALRAYRQAAADRQVMTLQQERVRVRVIDAPAYPLKANGPSRLVLVIVALIAALILSMATTLLINRWAADLAQGRESRPTAGPDTDEGRNTQADPLGARRVQAVGGTKV